MDNMADTDKNESPSDKLKSKFSILLWLGDGTP